MHIKEVKVHNFKSIVDTRIELNPLTVLVGANAAGKSNIINVFRFIQSIMIDGLENAIALQGGIKNISNANLPKGEKIIIGLTIDFSNENWMRHIQGSKIALKIENIDYEFSIRPNKRGFGYHIEHDFVRINYNCYYYDASANKENRYSDSDIKFCSEYERKSSTSKVQLKQRFDPEDAKEKFKDVLNDNASSFFTFLINEGKNNLMLSKLHLLLPPSFSGNSFIRIFDFDPKELKKSSSMASVKILEEDGSNLASILQVILRNKEKRKKLTLLLREFLPFVDSVSVENNPDKSFSYIIKECYNQRSFYANFLSDGTVSIIALILALYFEEESNVIILEEPERNIHPKLLSNLISAAEDVSKEKQIIITTHNPELLRQANIDSVRLVTRKTNGETTVSSPSSNETIISFLQNDLGLEDLFLQGLLEV